MICIRDGDAQLFFNADDVAITTLTVLTEAQRTEVIRRLIASSGQGKVGVRTITLSPIAQPGNGSEPG